MRAKRRTQAHPKVCTWHPSSRVRTSDQAERAIVILTGADYTMNENAALSDRIEQAIALPRPTPNTVMLVARHQRKSLRHVAKAPGGITQLNDE